MVHRPSQWSTVLCLHTLKADCPFSCLIPSTFLNLWLLVPLTAKQPIGWNIKAPPHFLWKQDDITSHKPSALSHPPHKVMVVFSHWYIRFQKSKTSGLCTISPSSSCKWSDHKRSQCVFTLLCWKPFPQNAFYVGNESLFMHNFTWKDLPFSSHAWLESASLCENISIH